MTERHEITVVVPKGGTLRIVGPGEPSVRVREALEAIAAVEKPDGHVSPVKKPTSTSVIQRFVREHADAVIDGVSGNINDEFAQAHGQSVPFADVVVAAREDGLLVGDVRRIVGDEISHSNLNSEDRSWARDTITNEMVELARRDYPIPEHDEPLLDHDFYPSAQ